MKRGTGVVVLAGLVVGGCLRTPPAAGPRPSPAASPTPRPTPCPPPARQCEPPSWPVYVEAVRVQWEIVDGEPVAVIESLGCWSYCK
jgi:hypothetical protein